MNKIEILKNNNVNVESALEIWGSEETYNESLSEFKESLNSKLASLETFKNSKDWENYQILAHSIKSELKYLGFNKDAEIFYEHELKGKESNEEYIITNFENLRQTINNINNLLNNYFSKKKIIIADDSNIILNFLKNNLNGKFEIIEAINGQEVIAKLNEENIYALLLDLNMPTSNGFDVLEYMKQNNLFDKIKVVIITGDDTEETIKKAFTYPIIDVLNKPFTSENINRIIGSIESHSSEKVPL
jgi:CheY-like chemotaxis protein